jgi:hypothetical protein
VVNSFSESHAAKKLFESRIDDGSSKEFQFGTPEELGNTIGLASKTHQSLEASSRVTNFDNAAPQARARELNERDPRFALRSQWEHDRFPVLELREWLQPKTQAP